GEHPAVLGEHRGTDAEARRRRIGVRLHGARRGAQFFEQPRLHFAGARHHAHKLSSPPRTNHEQHGPMSLPPKKQPRLQRLLARLHESFGAPAAPPLPTVLAHMLWENVAYLVDDERRAQAFAALEAATGLQPERVLALPLAQLRTFTQQGGIHADE